jgi:hypothetical protein
MLTLSAILTAINAVVITFALPLLTFLGVQKFIIQPRYEARISRRKYATALYIACKELSLHLVNALERLNSASSRIGEAMKKIPDHDFQGNPAWFTKEGYYTTVTAYKIAAVSAWLRVYQNALLFSSYPESQAFLNELYRRAQNLKLAFSTGTCLWYYYFDAIGERLIEESATEASPLSFAKFCARYANDRDFRLFLEQVHMYIWFLGDKDPKYVDTVPRIQESLLDLIGLLEKKNLLPGFRVERPETAVGELDRALAAEWSRRG